MSFPVGERRCRLRTVIAVGTGTLSAVEVLGDATGPSVRAPKPVTAVRKKSFWPCLKSWRVQGRISAIVFERTGGFMSSQVRRVG
jgi:hypothetical protein